MQLISKSLPKPHKGVLSPHRKSPPLHINPHTLNCKLHLTNHSQIPYTINSTKLMHLERSTPMTTYKSYNYSIQTDITKALSKYNRIMPGPRFNTLDGNILNLIRSFSETDTPFFMSNKELADVMIANPSTIQRSIDRLVNAKLISKEITYSNSKQHRVLTYLPQAVQNIIDLQ